jgi:hypothetical protein
LIFCVSAHAFVTPINGGITCLSLTRNHSLPKTMCKCSQLKDISGWQGNILYLQNPNFTHCRLM